MKAGSFFVAYALPISVTIWILAAFWLLVRWGMSERGRDMLAFNDSIRLDYTISTGKLVGQELVSAIAWSRIKSLGHGLMVDHWGTSYRVSFNETLDSELCVHSAGADKLWGSPDDLSITSRGPENLDWWRGLRPVVGPIKRPLGSDTVVCLLGADTRRHVAFAHIRFTLCKPLDFKTQDSSVTVDVVDMAGAPAGALELSFGHGQLRVAREASGGSVAFSLSEGNVFELCLMPNEGLLSWRSGGVQNDSALTWPELVRR
jgi:hypothetical protein